MTVMFLDVYGVIRTDKVIVILPFGASLNFSNYLYFGSMFKKRAEISGFLPQEEHGGRSVHTSIEVAVLRSLFLTM